MPWRQERDSGMMETLMKLFGIKEYLGGRAPITWFQTLIRHWDISENVIEPVLWACLCVALLTSLLLPFAFGGSNSPYDHGLRSRLRVSAREIMQRPTPSAEPHSSRTETFRSDVLSTGKPTASLSPSNLSSGAQPQALGGPAIGATWGQGKPVDPTGASLSVISCVSVSFCLTAGALGSFEWNGVAWSGPTLMPPGIVSALSCASTRFCVAGVANSLVIWDGTVWKNLFTPVNQNYLMVSVSCPSSSFCMALSNGPATAYIWNGSSWAASAIVVGGPIGKSPGAVGCSSALNCVASLGNLSYFFNGSKWTPGSEIRPVGTLAIISSMSCPQSSFCVVSGSGGAVSWWDGTAWTFDAIDAFNSAPASSQTWYGGEVSCTSSTFCMDVETDGNTAAWDGVSWILFSGINPPNQAGSNAFQDVSCVNTSFCMAITGNGEAFTFGR